jgi:hypothetical protein
VNKEVTFGGVTVKVARGFRRQLTLPQGPESPAGLAGRALRAPAVKWGSLFPADGFNIDGRSHPTTNCTVSHNARVNEV